MKRLGYIVGNRPLLAFLVWILVCLLALCVVGSRANWRLIKSRNTNEAVSKQLGFIGYALYDTYSSLHTWSDEKRLSFLDTEPYQAFLETTRKDRNVEVTTTKKNIIYLQLESVDGISVRADYNGEKVMPFLNSLTQKSLYFPNTIDNSSSGRTTDGEFLVLCSLPPIKGKPIYVSYPLDQIPSLPRALTAEGYSTFSIHGHDGKFWNRAQSHAQLGYQDSYFKEDLDRSETIGWGVSDNSVLQQAVEKLKESEKPVFAHIILLTNHHPYNHVGHAFGYEKGEFVADHVDSLRYVDLSIRNFFMALEREGFLESSVVAIYSDHDSAIESQLRKHYRLANKNVPRDTVPLLIYGLDRSPRVIDKTTGLQDLPVIVLEQLGLPVPFSFSGNPLASLNPTVSPTGYELDFRNGELTKTILEIDVSTLTKLALLHPEKLDTEN